ncbi:hypothetical protein ACP70R_041949 [Stipagrostis hirtigluma subsp. patula]
MESPAPSSSQPPRTRPRAPVRVVGRICPAAAAAGGGGGGGGGLFKVAARVSDEDSSAVVSVTPLHAAPGATPARREHDYRLDWCYLKDDADRHVFDREVGPLVDAAFEFRGANACVITCGAASKTQLVMGSQDQPGLLTMTMHRILQLSRAMGASVSVSSYQVLQDSRVFDLLEPKDSEVLVLDADGKTNLKGLSRVDVKSVEELVDLCCCSNDKLKPPAKPSHQTQARGHQGFIFYISKFHQQGRECAAAKINFLDLAGYVDPKQKNNSDGGLVPPNCNKSMNALMNVVRALNSNNQFIPYRQSKVTRILQDSLCRTSNAVLIARLDEISNQDAVSTLNLASCSSQLVNEQSQFQFNNSAVKASRTPTANKRFEASMHSAKKSARSVSTSIKMKQKGTKYTPSGRKLFCPSTDPSKEDKIVIAPPVVTNAEDSQLSFGMGIRATLPLPAEGCDEKENVIDVISSEMQGVVPSSMQQWLSSGMQEKEQSSSDLQAECSCTDLSETCSSDVTDGLVEKTPITNIQSSPKVSEQLKEISNTMKLLSARPVPKQQIDMVRAQHFDIDTPEPKTPTVQLKFSHAEDPQDLLKKCVEQDCLAFLNSANKEQLKSLKGIGEKRANHIIQLREESPEPLKEIDDLRSIIGMNGKEIKKMISGLMYS